MRFRRDKRHAEDKPGNLPVPAGAGADAGMPAKVLSHVLESSARLQAPAVKAYVARLRRSAPEATPAEIVARLEKQYLAVVMASGAAVGSAAAFPGIGTLAALSAVAGETVLFLEATAAFALAVAEVHGIEVEDRDRRRNLVLGVLVGDEGRGAVRDLLGPGRTSGAWLAEAELLPLPVVSQLNSRLMQYFVKKYTIKRTAMAFGKMLPVGIGAAIGGGGNRMMGRKIIANARTAFGPAPARWPGQLQLLPPIADAQ
ncbi:MAG: hypothetical protein FGM50_03025 [Mycobacterium sp.]|nr:hypothetical protein [Mycobacterium sp.]